MFKKNKINLKKYNNNKNFNNNLPDFIIISKYIVTVNKNNDILLNHSLVIKNDKIIDILNNDECKKKYKNKVNIEVIDVSDNHVITPGFINAHTHTPMVFMRGFGDDLELTNWLTTKIWPAEGKLVNEEFVKQGTLIAIAEMIRCGTTTFNDSYFFPKQSSIISKKTGIRSFIGLPILEFPTNYAKDADDYLNKSKNILDDYTKNNKDDDLINFTVSPHAPYSVKDYNLKKSHDLAKENNIPLHTHGKYLIFYY